jgi:hypothetical protein
MSYDNGEVRATYTMEEALDENRQARAQLTALSICHRWRPDRDHETRQERTNQHHGTEKIEAQMNRIERVLQQLAAVNIGYRRRPRSTSRFQGHRTRSNSRNREHQPNLCYYHQTYQARAKNCRPPCTWNHGKPQQSPVNAAYGNDGSTAHRIFVTDVSTKTSFLIDTGADVCVYPRSKIQEKPRKDDYELFAVNGTTIATYGTIPLSLNLRLRRDFKWRFIVADVSRPIIGMDFLTHYGLLVDP